MSQDQEMAPEKAPEKKAAKAEVQDAVKEEAASARILHFREASGEAAPAGAKAAPKASRKKAGADAPSAPEQEPAGESRRRIPDGALPVGLVAEIRGQNGAPDMAALQLNERAEMAVVASAPFFAACARTLASRLAIERTGWNLTTCRRCGMGCPERRGQCRNVDFWLEAAFRAVRAMGGEAPVLADVRGIAAAARRAKAGDAPAAPEAPEGDKSDAETSTPRHGGDNMEKRP